VKIAKNLRCLTQRPLPQTQDQVQVSANAARLWIILPHRTEVTDKKISCWRPI